VDTEGSPRVSLVAPGFDSCRETYILELSKELGPSSNLYDDLESKSSPSSCLSFSAQKRENEVGIEEHNMHISTFRLSPFMQAIHGSHD
jgi:hypothetical protein